MSSFFVPIHVRDVDFIKKITGASFDSAEICCFGIEVCERALSAGARNVSFHEIAWETLCESSQIPDSSASLARSFDATHSELRVKYLGLDVASTGWDYLNIYWISQSVLAIQSTFVPFVEKLPKSGRPALFMVPNSQDFYFDSALTRGIVRNLVSKRFQHSDVIELPPGEIFKPNANHFSLEIPSGGFRILTHLPTIFYSASLHLKRLRADGGEELLDLESPYFDIPISPRRIRLGVRKHHDMNESFSRYLRAYEILLGDLYKTLDVLEEARLSGMFERHKDWAISQYYAYRSLCDADSLNHIERIEMSCHDTGLAGPLISWANQREIPVHMWPHSEVINSVAPFLRKGQKHSHVEGALLPLELGVGKSEWTDLKKRTSATNVEGKTLLILLNQLDTSYYFPNCRILDLRHVLHDFIQRMAREGWHVRLRQKPSHAYNILLGFEDVEYATGPLEALAGWPAVCVSVGSPTTALIGFWREGARCYHVQEGAISLAERYIIPSREVGVFHSERFCDLFERVFEKLIGRVHVTESKNI